jgi:hypothetical protein
MTERDWKDEQRDVLTRLFDAAFERRETPEEDTRADIHGLCTVDKPQAPAAP